MKKIFKKSKNKIKKMPSYFTGDRIIKDKNDISLRFLLTGTLLVVFITLSFLLIKDPRGYTISYIGNNGFRLMYIVWAILSAGVLGLIMVRMHNYCNYESSRCRNYIKVAYLSLLACTIIPSGNGVGRQIQVMHNLTAVLYAFFTLLSFFLFLYYVFKVDKKLGIISWITFAGFILIPLCSYMIYGHCGVYEILFSVAIALFMIVFYIILSRNNIKFSKNNSLLLKKNNTKNINKHK